MPGVPVWRASGRDSEPRFEMHRAGRIWGRASNTDWECTFRATSRSSYFQDRERMKRPSRAAIVHGFFILFAVTLVARAAKVQVVEGKQWSMRAKRQHFIASPLSAPRGEILDASGNTLVESREMTRVAVALPEVRDTAFVLKALHRARVDVDALHAAIARRRRWIDLPGVYSAADVASISKLN